MRYAILATNFNLVEECLPLPLTEATPLLERIITHVDRFYPPSAETGRLTSIAITLPGIIDTENGVVHRMPYYEDVKECLWEMRWAAHRRAGYIQHDIGAGRWQALFGALTRRARRYRW